ncbi:MAG: type II toxin-antitoxin system Phd/YefM family antitoxin [Pseudomonadota bacterium]
MGKVWQIQDAKARFGEFLDVSLREDPRIVTKRGIETAVSVPIEQWRRLQATAQPCLNELLLSNEARADTLVPPRVAHRHRVMPVFDD